MLPEWSDLKASENETAPISNDLHQWLEQEQGHYIDGKWKRTDVFFATEAPATGTPLSLVAQAEKGHVDQAVGAASKAFREGTWVRASLDDRAKVLHQIADKIDAHRATLAVLESLDTGKPIQEAFHGDIPRAALNFRFFADYARSQGDRVFSQPEVDHTAIREPLGVAALITPWNLPLYLESWKIAPCLMMGNSCVLKPSELTPLTASFLAHLIDETPLPKGVFNVVQGFGENAAGQWLCDHPEIDAISFTGETITGQAIMKSAASHLTRVSFELGGKGASVVFADADYEKALATCLRAAFRNQGEICLASPRIFVERSLYDRFVGDFVKQAEALRLGDPLHFQTQMGALISADHRAKVAQAVDGVSDSALVVCGGRSWGEQGYFYQPTVITGAQSDEAISQKEIFGPVVCLYPFDDEASAVEAVNGTAYGLSASVWTSNGDRADRVAREIRTGLVWINSWFDRDLRVPFGGQKRSGVGREGGEWSLDFFSQWKSIGRRKGQGA